MYCYITYDNEVLGAVLSRQARRLEDQHFLRYIPMHDQAAYRQMMERLAVRVN